MSDDAYPYSTRRISLGLSDGGVMHVSLPGKPHEPVDEQTLEALRSLGEAAIARMELDEGDLTKTDWVGPVLRKHAINRAFARERRGMASTRCKFTCHSIIDGYGGAKVVNLSAVYAPDDPESENGQFWTATPNGQISLQINNPDGYAVFEQGKAYYVDLTPVDA